jgi:Hypothetical glycosyl hydrolase family 15
LRSGIRLLLAVSFTVLIAAAAEPRTALSVSPARTDQRGFPRTLAFAKCSNVRDIARRDMIVGPAYCPISELRKRNPTGIFLLQPGLFPTGYDSQGQAGYGGMNVTYGAGLWYWRTSGCDSTKGGMNVGCMRAFDFDYDYMHNADGSYAGIDSSPAAQRGFNLADPLHRGTAELVAKFTAYVAKLDGLYSKGWSGIFSDNWIYGILGASYAYGPNLDTNRDGKVDELAPLRKAWDNGLNAVGTQLRSFLPGKIIVGNENWFGMEHYFGDDPQGWLKSANGTMVEGIDRYYESPGDWLKVGSRWLGFGAPAPRYLLALQNALDMKGDRLTIPSGANPNDPRYMLDPGVMQSMRWGLTLAMMNGAYYELLLNANQDTSWWYDEYDGGKGVRRRDYLGRALGTPVQIRSGVWRRDFEHGIALNNSTSAAVRINLKKPFRHLRGSQNPRLNNGKIVSEVTVAGHDGLILLNVKPRK